MENETSIVGGEIVTKANENFTAPVAVEPNLIFIRKVESKGETVAAEPPAFIVIPVGEKIKLPDAETQLKGFYHERSGEIIRSMPKSYKEFKQKGK